MKAEARRLGLPSLVPSPPMQLPESLAREEEVIVQVTAAMATEKVAMATATAAMVITTAMMAYVMAVMTAEI